MRRKMNHRYTLLLISILAICFQSCRKDVELVDVEVYETADLLSSSRYKGFYLLNEGNMGQNLSTLDFLDFGTGKYHKNIYASRNPNVVKELGDVGNDLKIYGSKLYAVINCSNKVEIMDANTTKQIKKITIPNCRYIAFSGRYAYVSSYAGPVEINPDYKQIGYVARIDTVTLRLKGRCLVGYQPDELAIVGNKIYVANSGGYMGAGNSEGYERTVSVIDIDSFTEVKRIDVAPNLHRVRADKRGNLWVSSRGDYKTIPPRLYFIDTSTDEVKDVIETDCSGMWLQDEYLYLYGKTYSKISGSWGEPSFGILDTRTHKMLDKSLITDGTKIATPYGIMVNPITLDVYITDAGSYVGDGILYCFDKNGHKKWSVRAGNIPGHFALLKK